MSTQHRSPPSFFLVPDEKHNYEDTVQLGNTLYRIAEPDNVLSSHPLKTSPSTKTLQNYRISNDANKSHKIGLFTKILDLLNFGINGSTKRAKADQEAYTISSMSITSFKPSKEYLALLEEEAALLDYLRNSIEKSAFLITGVVLATGVDFTSSMTRESEHEGSVGIASPGVSLGPSGSRLRKNTLQVSYTDAGPVVLAYRVHKLSMAESGQLTAELHTDGAYFGDEEGGGLTMRSDAKLDDADTEGFERVEEMVEVDGEEYALWAAS